MRVRPRGKRTRVTVEKRGGADGVCEHRGTDDSRKLQSSPSIREREGEGGETGDGGGSRGGTRKGARRKTKERIDDGGGGDGGKEK